MSEDWIVGPTTVEEDENGVTMTREVIKLETQNGGFLPAIFDAGPPQILVPAVGTGRIFSMGQWCNVTIAGRAYLAMASVEVGPKYVVVIYRNPNVSARYVRGESLFGWQEALDAAATLLEPEVPWQVGDGT